MRPHLIPPVQTAQAPATVQIGAVNASRNGDAIQILGISDQHGAWILGNRLVDPAGHTVTKLPSACVQFLENGSSSGFLSCLGRDGMTFAVSYQPAGRYWELQSAETGMDLVLAAGLGALCYWAVRRRQRAA